MVYCWLPATEICNIPPFDSVLLAASSTPSNGGMLHISAAGSQPYTIKWWNFTYFRGWQPAVPLHMKQILYSRSYVPYSLWCFVNCLIVWCVLYCILYCATIVSCGPCMYASQGTTPWTLTGARVKVHLVTIRHAETTSRAAQGSGLRGLWTIISPQLETECCIWGLVVAQGPPVALPTCLCACISARLFGFPRVLGTEGLCNLKKTCVVSVRRRRSGCCKRNGNPSWPAVERRLSYTLPGIDYQLPESSSS